MKKCENCGYVKLSPREQEIFDLLPATVNQINERIELGTSPIREYLHRMMRNGVVSQSEGKEIIWVRSMKAGKAIEEKYHG